MNTEIDPITSIETQIKATTQELNKLKHERYLLVSANKPVVDKKALRKQEKIERNKTTNGLTIHKLRLAGNDVTVTHIRFTPMNVTRTVHVDGVECEQEITYYQPVPSYMRNFYTFHGKGGSTYIQITRPDGSVLSISSHCHELDPFEYKRGVKLALDQLDQAEADELLKPQAPVNVCHAERPCVCAHN